jgi:hypothetical protein
LEALAAVLDADGRDPVPCDRMLLTVVLSELFALRSMVRAAMDDAHMARHALSEWLGEDQEVELEVEVGG